MDSHCAKAIVGSIQNIDTLPPLNGLGLKTLGHRYAKASDELGHPGA
jgi:hypothetical protein